MNIEFKRHKLLKILSIHRNKVELNKGDYNALGVSFKKIYCELKCTEDQLKVISSELYSEDEIGYHNAHNIVGVFAKRNGLTAFANRKYIRIYWKRAFDLAKNIIQIVIPILSLLIAFLALTIKVETLNKSNKEKIDKLEMEIKILKKELQTERVRDAID